MHLLRFNGEKIGKFVVFIGDSQALRINLKRYLGSRSPACSYHLIGFRIAY